MTCIGKDPRCPCQDGDACHYKDCGGTKAWPVPKAEPPSEWLLIKNILDEYGLDAISFVAEWKAAQQAEPTCPDCKAAVLYECVACSSNNYPPKQQAEPVAWTTMPEAEDWCFVSGNKDPTGKLEGKWFPLYTTPPQRQWVGLTDEEIRAVNAQVSRIPPIDYTTFTYARAVETKLKERNT